jgi:poly-gamma-glutamate capsule biosynthesis protein CapA/YwtB (metallophosphatase superfamily)
MGATARLAFLGDTMLGGAAQHVVEQHGYGCPLDDIRPLWSDADLVVANHEAPLTRQPKRMVKADTGRARYWYKADPESAHALKAYGVDVVSLANNHVGDFGPDGVLDSMAALDSAGIAHCGAGATDTAARRPVMVDVGGLRIGFLSVMQRYEMYLADGLYARRGNPGPARLRVSRLGPDIRALREEVDLCVVLVHWGRNYRPVTSLQRRLARMMRAAGADLVVGHHPHIAQHVEVVAGVPVFYSLGNAAFGTVGRFGADHPPYGLVGVVDVQRHRVVGVDVRPMLVDNQRVRFRPRPADDPDARAFRATMLTEPAATPAHA